MLIEDEEILMGPGDAAGWKAGRQIGHCLENRSGEDAVILVVGTRANEGIVHYPDHDVTMHHSDAGKMFTRLDGSPLNQTK